MYYTPKYKTIKELITLREFIELKTRGWVKMSGKKKSHRLHLLPHAGEIGRMNLHEDTTHDISYGKMHKSDGNSFHVRQEMEEIKKLDVSDKWYVRIWNNIWQTV